MDLSGFPIQASSATVEEKALLEKIERHITIAKKLLRENRMTQYNLNNLIGFLRAQMTKLYGKDLEITKYFRPITVKLDLASITEKASILIEHLEHFLYQVKEIGAYSFTGGKKGKIFIGHGHSPIWRELKDFLSDRLNLDWDEFNREAVAGFTTFERLSLMLSDAKFAFLILTAEDEHLDQSLHARENVVHEVGLFQGRLGPKKAIILLEAGCKEFSNIVGLSQIHFPKGYISAAFEEIRRVLEREGILQI